MFRNEKIVEGAVMGFEIGVLLKNGQLRLLNIEDKKFKKIKLVSNLQIKGKILSHSVDREH